MSDVTWLQPFTADERAIPASSDADGLRWITGDLRDYHGITVLVAEADDDKLLLKLSTSPDDLAREVTYAQGCYYLNGIDTGAQHGRPMRERWAWLTCRLPWAGRGGQ
jgi:hypothetical protein